MAKKCIYCAAGIPAESVLDVCDPCGHKVWGPKMLKAIRENMEGAKVKGNLEQGSVGS